VFIADTQHHRIRKVGNDGRITTVAGTGSASAPVPGPALQSPITSPLGVVVDQHGTLYVLSTTNVLLIKNGVLSILARGVGNTGLTLDASGSVYVGRIVA